MDHPRACSHPLNPSGGDRTSSSPGIPMLHFPLDGKGHGFKTPVRMFSYSEFLLGWREISGCSMVHQEERTDAVHIFGVHGEDRADMESVSNPMLLPRGNDFLDLFLLRQS